MKIRSLLLGSVAAAGLTTAGYATDLGVVTSLNVCDELGLSGLAISSDDNCLVISGGVTYEYKFGDFDDSFLMMTNFNRSGNAFSVMEGDTNLDSSSELDAWLQFTASASSSFGLATATIKLVNGTVMTGPASSVTNGVFVDEAFITIGDTTMLTAGKTGTIFKDGDDEPLNFLGLFNSDDVDVGVNVRDPLSNGGHVIQLVSDLGNGVWIGGALENLGTGSLGSNNGIGVISYSGDGLTAHASINVANILGGSPTSWDLHTGATATWDNFKFVGALATRDGGWWNVLGSASATFDMFTLAGSFEATSEDEWGAGGSISATVSDGVTLNLGGRYWDNDVPNDVLTQVAAQIVATVSDDVKVTGEIGAIANSAGTLVNPSSQVFYVKGQADWSPGGGVDASVSAQANTVGAWQTDFKISKSIK